MPFHQFHDSASGLIDNFSPNASKCCNQRFALDDPFNAFAGRTVFISR
jgi:hypothetical protein